MKLNKNIVKNIEIVIELTGIFRIPIITSERLQIAWVIITLTSFFELIYASCNIIPISRPDIKPVMPYKWERLNNIDVIITDKNIFVFDFIFSYK